jgi:hypothetical protein
LSEKTGKVDANLTTYRPTGETFIQSRTFREAIVLSKVHDVSIAAKLNRQASTPWWP